MKYLISTFFCFFLLVSCSEDSTTEEKKTPETPETPETPKEPKKQEFSVKNMLIFWVDNIIIPGYEDLELTSSQMKESIMKFTENPTVSNLKQARVCWQKSYEVWQRVSVNQLGKISSIKRGFRARLNSYPTNTESILKYIEEGKYDFSSGKMTTSEGFPALDYLLNAPKKISSDDEIVNLYKKNPKFKKYIIALAEDINSLAAEVSKYWKNGYREKFIKKDGNGRRSSLSKVITHYVHAFYKSELLEKKIARPSAANSSHMYPEKVEAFYKKDISKKLYITALESAIDFFKGKSYDGKKTGYSIEQYLTFLNKKELVKLINKKFNDITQANQSIEDNMYEQIMHPDKKSIISTTTYNKLNILLRILKVDMMCAVGLSDGSSDNDSDND